jgi:hypothetical protein
MSGSRPVHVPERAVVVPDARPINVTLPSP